MFCIPIIITIKDDTPKDTGLSGARHTRSTIRCGCGYCCLRDHAKDILIICPRCNKRFDFRNGFTKFIDKYIKFW